jgi:CheY-like chemotaxis protein
MKYKKVLYIDDDEDDLEIFCATVEEFDSKIICITFTSAKAALKKLNSGELCPDITFIDLNMPGMDGFQFLAEIKKSHECNFPIVVLSTCRQQSTIDKVKELGADGYISKPSSIKEFVKLLTPFFAETESKVSRSIKQA